ncbi:MAG: hypothetical protein RIE73_34035 [Coleofasciculus sp. C1-SOL-03]|uniref:hypothetical protein n=1 Tax=Coleofasciculus sp. C1-SOL-03 TaxID=3069522 RepID=UPI0032FE1E7E
MFIKLPGGDILIAPLLSPETLPDGIPEKLFIYRNMENEGDLSKGKPSGVPEAAGSKHRNATPDKCFG